MLEVTGDCRFKYKFKEGDRVIWRHIHNIKRKPKTVYKTGEYQRIRKHKSDYHGPQMAVVILDEAFCEAFVPILELTLER